MKKTKVSISITKPVDQLSLFGYENYFYLFKKLIEANSLPNCILLSGPKGIGKATFSYHLINFILSKGEKYEYSFNDFKINQSNSSYNKIKDNIHPNFFLLSNYNEDDEIKIDQVRQLLKFLNKSTYTKNLKIVLIDNFESFNINSKNAILKAIEEPALSTFFFIIHNNSFKLLETIKSRCSEFKINFSEEKKKSIFAELISQTSQEPYLTNIGNNLFFETPGNLFKYHLYLCNEKISVDDDNLSCIEFFLDKFDKEKSLSTILPASYFIEKFYNDLCYKNPSNLIKYFYDYSQILKHLNDMRRFKLYEKNTLSTIRNILSNESK